MPPRREHDEARPTELQHDVGDREHPGPFAERIGDRDAHDEGHEREGDHGAAHRQPDGVEPVRHPGRRDPAPPERDDHDRALEGAERILVLVEVGRELREREDEDEIEEQLDVRDPVGPRRARGTEDVAPESEGHGP
jgi:hypothetical protein